MAAWDPDEGLRLIEEERVSFMGAPPVFFSQMAGSAGFRPGAGAQPAAGLDGRSLGEPRLRGRHQPRRSGVE